MPIIDTDIAYVSKLAIKAGRAAKKLQQENRLVIHRKKFEEIVSDADLRADAIIRRGLLSAYPDSRIFSEEANTGLTQASLQKGDWWIVDPIDGTVNFVHGLPMSAVSIGRAVNGKLVMGVVYNIFIGELFIAKRGQGAFLNGKQIWCNNHGDASRAIIACGFAYDKRTHARALKKQAKVLSTFQDVRRIGSAALDLCHVACGRLDGYYEDVNIWDIAAARVIAEEAGVKVETVASNGAPAILSGKQLVAASPKLFARLKTTTSVR